MVENAYQYALVIYKGDRTPAGCASLAADWEPAAEYAQFCFIRKGELPAALGGRPISIQPLWDRTEGEPYCRGFRVWIARDGDRPVTSDFTTRYFHRLAASAAAQLIKQGKLETESDFQYVVIAYPTKAEPAPQPAAFTVEEKPQPLRLVDSFLPAWTGNAAPMGLVDPDDMPVFIPRRVLDETAELTRAEQGQETGGVLIGNLRRDVGSAEVFAEVTAQIPAPHTVSNAVKLTFTAEAWSAVNAAIELRGSSEIYLGYWHSHPVREWCKSRECSLERQKACRLARDFFSEDDQALLRAAFPRAYSIGVVVNDTAFTDLTFSLFGWREGFIQPRGFYVLEKNDVAA